MLMVCIWQANNLKRSKTDIGFDASGASSTPGTWKMDAAPPRLKPRRSNPYPVSVSVSAPVRRAAAVVEAEAVDDIEVSDSEMWQVSKSAGTSMRSRLDTFRYVAC